MSIFFKVLQITFFCCIFPLYSNPDLTIIGFVAPEDGLGKIPITILETLGEDVSANIRLTRLIKNQDELPQSVLAAIYNPERSAGKIALSTELFIKKGAENYIGIPKESIVKLAYSMLETTRIPSIWVKILNEEFDAVIVPDQFLVQVYQDCGVHIPIFVLPIPMMLAPYFARPLHPKSPSNPFVFGDASANKNPSALVEGFAKAFGNDPSVQLVMRACVIRDETRESVNQLISQYGLTNVTLENGGISLEQYIDRLASFDCYVNLSRGEGFSLIPREALALGLPVIITDNTASTTICDSGFVRAVPSKKRGPSNSIYKKVYDEDCGEQFDCEVEDVAAALRDVYENYEEYILKAQEGCKWVNQYYCANPELRELYRTLIKPKQVILGNNNEIGKGVIITNSTSLLEKYQWAIKSGWSMPEEVIHPQQDEKEGFTPFIATGGNGSSVAIWYDKEGGISGFGSMKGAVLSLDKDTNTSEKDWKLTSPISLGGVQLPFSSLAQAVGMDAQGNAIAVWADKNNQIRAAQLLAGSLQWTIFPEPLNQSKEKVNSPYIAMASNGTAVVGWTTMTDSLKCRLHANVFDSRSKKWRGEKEIFEEAIQSVSNINQVAIDPHGNAVAIVSLAADSIKASRFNFESNSWKEIAPLSIDSSSKQSFVGVALDSIGNAVFVWAQNHQSLYSASLPCGQENLINRVLLSDRSTDLFSSPAIKSDQDGNAIAVWSEGSIGLGSARYSVSLNTWEILPPLDLKGKVPLNINLAVDKNGNAIAIWSFFTDGEALIQAAVLATGESSWRLLTRLTSQGQNQNPQAIITSDGHAISIWENEIGFSLLGSIEFSKYLNLFPLAPESIIPPEPPITFIGRAIKKNNPKHSPIHKLKWKPSPDPFVRFYLLYRNETVIAVFSSGLDHYVFNDIGRDSEDTYHLVAIDERQEKSNKLTVILN